MISDFLLPLVPDYGLYLVGATVFLAALGIPLPSSIVVLTSGGLAATGDLNIVQLLITCFLAFVFGDQLAYAIGAKAGPDWIYSMKRKPSLASVISRAENLYDNHGKLAVFLSRTVLSPSGPCIAYLSGASSMRHTPFTMIAALGALVWTGIYSLMGYGFTGHVPAISDVVASSLAVIAALLLAAGFALWLVHAWRQFEVDLCGNEFPVSGN